MDYEFKSKEDLYKRALPALKLKVKEIEKFGFSEVDSSNIWDFLIDTKWKSGFNLQLSDIVNDIMYLKVNDIIPYLEKIHNN